MKIWLFVATLGVSVLFGSPVASADANSYLDYLHSNGGPAWPDGQMVSGGLHLCELMRAGMTPEAAVGSLGITAALINGPLVAEAARKELCPETLKG